jgi:hypothetical protein
MTLEESHCQASKRPNRGFVNAKHLWVDGLTIIQESHFHAANMPNSGSINNMVGGSHYSWGILQSTVKLKCLKKTHVTLGERFTTCNEQVFRPQKFLLCAHSKPCKYDPFKESFSGRHIT